MIFHGLFSINPEIYFRIFSKSSSGIVAEIPSGILPKIAMKFSPGVFPVIYTRTRLKIYSGFFHGHPKDFFPEISPNWNFAKILLGIFQRLLQRISLYGFLKEFFLNSHSEYFKSYLSEIFKNPFPKILPKIPPGIFLEISHGFLQGWFLIFF